MDCLNYQKVLLSQTRASSPIRHHSIKTNANTIVVMVICWRALQQKSAALRENGHQQEVHFVEVRLSISGQIIEG
jgi:hypothetical protein